MDRKLDSIFEYKGVTLKVISGIGCKGCYFRDNICVKPKDFDFGPCSPIIRDDNNSIIFKEINNNNNMDRELGAKFEFNGTTLKVVKGKFCYGCYFYNGGICDKPNNVIGSCTESTRKDKESVIYKEIKNNMEERNIKLSIEKAREFYSKGGEFKDLALSAFTEDEILISKLPKTWEEFCKNNLTKYKKSYFIDREPSIKVSVSSRVGDADIDRNLLPSREAVEQHLALMQLHQLRDCYRQGWIPDLEDESFKYCIEGYYNSDSRSIKHRVGSLSHTSTFLSFPTNKLAEEFLNNFRDLIVKAGDLI